MEKGKNASCAKRLTLALSIRNMKQTDLCACTGIPKSAMSQYVKGSFEPKQDRIFLMAKALDVSEAWLMGYDVPMEKENLSPSEENLTEGEKILLDLFRRIPEDDQQLVLQMIRVALGNREQ